MCRRPGHDPFERGEGGDGGGDERERVSVGGVTTKAPGMVGLGGTSSSAAGDETRAGVKPLRNVDFMGEGGRGLPGSETRSSGGSVSGNAEVNLIGASSPSLDFDPLGEEVETSGGGVPGVLPSIRRSRRADHHSRLLAPSLA
jgi:hypothetical protein